MPVRGRLLGRWPEWSARAAAVWSLVYAGVGLAWALDAPAFPYGGSSQRVVGSLIAGLGMAGVLVAYVMPTASPRLRWILIGFGWAASATLVVGIQAFLLLDLIQLATLGLVHPVDWAGFVNRALCVVGGIAWAAAALAYTRRARGTCMDCGRSGASEGTGPRWGTWVTHAAVLAPLPYSIWRLLWALGIPFGINEDDLHHTLDSPGAGSFALLGLTLASEGGALLALGLIRPWGEVFPRWIPFLGGKPVRPRTAIIPAALVAAMMTSISLTVLVDGLANGTDAGEVQMPTWAGLLLGVFPFLAWGIFLAAATLAYYYRRRGNCFRCDNHPAASS